jgi:hypothetical protein
MLKNSLRKYFEMTKQTKNKTKKIVFAIFCLFGVCVFTAFKFNPSITIKEDDGLYIIKIAQSENLKIYPYVSENLKYNSEIFEQSQSLDRIKGLGTTNPFESKKDYLNAKIDIKINH